MLAQKMKKVYLKSYQTLGFVVLSTFILGMITYGSSMLFFMFNSNWIAPVIMSKTSDKMLQFAAGYQQAVAAQQTSLVIKQQTHREAQLAKNNFGMFKSLQIKQTGYSAAMASLNTVKHADISQSTQLASELATVEHQVNDELRAGVLTKQDATQLFTYIRQFNNNVSDQSVGVQNNKMLVLNQEAQLIVQLGQAESDVQTKNDMTAAADINYNLAEEEVETLESSVYYAARKSGMNLAFLPYGNNKAKVGAPVYDCYLSFIVCRKVGIISHVFSDEQLVDFPLFNLKLNRTVRGTFVAINATDQTAMQDQVLFVGSKPLLF